MAGKSSQPNGVTLPAKVRNASAALTLILGGIYTAEGGYSNQPNDPGKATNYGVTERVARANGYHGNMRYFPKHCDGPATACADGIYVKQYIAAPGYMPLVTIEPAVADKLANTAVNMGPPRPNRWFRNTMRKLAEFDLPGDGAALGTADVDAYHVFRDAYGDPAACIETLDDIEAQQINEYRRLVLANSKLRQFLTGWLKRARTDHRELCGLTQ